MVPDEAPAQLRSRRLPGLPSRDIASSHQAELKDPPLLTGGVAEPEKAPPAHQQSTPKTAGDKHRGSAVCL